MVAAVVNSAQESAIVVQLLYMTMLFISGATFPSSMFPDWLLSAAQFIPATWLVTGLQGILLRRETLLMNWQATGALSTIGQSWCALLSRMRSGFRSRRALLSSLRAAA